MTVSEAQAKKAELEAKIAAGEKSVRFADRGVENMSIAEMMQAIDYLDRIIAGGSSQQPGNSRTSVGWHDRDL